MKLYELFTEGKRHPIICVDVQPEYAHGFEDKMHDIIQFVCENTGPVLMFVNAADSGVSADSIGDIKQYWDEHNYTYNTDDDDNPISTINWNRFQIVDKGFCHFRAWMDSGVSDSLIIKMIRYLYQQKKDDARMLFGGEYSDEYFEKFEEFMGSEFQEHIPSEVFCVNWTSVTQLKKFDGAYIIGGGRNECLREVELLMNAFNIKYKRIDNLVYG